MRKRSKKEKKIYNLLLPPIIRYKKTNWGNPPTWKKKWQTKRTNATQYNEHKTAHRTQHLPHILQSFLLILFYFFPSFSCLPWVPRKLLQTQENTQENSFCIFIIRFIFFFFLLAFIFRFHFHDFIFSCFLLVSLASYRFLVIFDWKNWQTRKYTK